MGNSSARKSDIVNIVILAALASCIGAYLVATAVLIAEDGVRYVEEARSFSVDPAQGVKGEAFGYPFLIFAAHKIAVLFGAGSSIRVWIYSAQGVALLCRVLTLIPLYFIGRILVGGRFAVFVPGGRAGKMVDVRRSGIYVGAGLYNQG